MAIIVVKDDLSVLESINQNEIIACLGEFDGMHIGHKALFDKCIEVSKKLHKKTAIISLYPHPDYVLDKREDVGYLQTSDERANLVSKMGMDYYIQIEFNLSLSKLNFSLFFEKYLKDFYGLVCGKDYRFGALGLGTYKYLEENAHNLYLVDTVFESGKKISSNDIRALLSNGDVLKANKLLIEKYSFDGWVVRGKELGRTISFPTANLSINPTKFVPKFGVYISTCEVRGNTYYSLTNIGTNPTVNKDKKELDVETHIFGFNEDIYDENIKVCLLYYYREEIVFDNLEQLKIQILDDVCKAKELIEELKL